MSHISLSKNEKRREKHIVGKNLVLFNIYATTGIRTKMYYKSAHTLVKKLSPYILLGLN